MLAVQETGSDSNRVRPKSKQRRIGRSYQKKINRANYGIVQMPLVEVLIQKKKDKEL
jgi:hypothetical protein